MANSLLKQIYEVKSVRKFNYELCLFYIAAFVGGFFAGYAVIRCGMFASSQTMNIISIMLSLFGKDFGEFMVRLLIMLLYACAIALGIIIPRYTKLDVRLVSISVTSFAAVLLACIPTHITITLSMVPVFFSMALQWSAFPGAMGYQASCIFVTNNFRQSVTGGVNYLCTKDKKYISQFLFYAGDIAVYFIGFISCYLCIKLAGLRSVAFILLPLVFMSVMIYKEKNINTVGIREK